MEYISGGLELAAEMEPLWQRLNAHHSEVSVYFGDFYKRVTYEMRMDDIRKNADAAHIIIAREGGRNAGYTMASMEGKVGEIASIYVEPDFRGTGLADRLMEMTVEWLRAQGAKRLELAVTYGNERAFNFYSRHGFYPRTTVLHFTERPLKDE